MNKRYNESPFYYIKKEFINWKKIDKKLFQIKILLLKLKGYIILILYKSLILYLILLRNGFNIF